jgi:hypothetical protein
MTRRRSKRVPSTWVCVAFIVETIMLAVVLWRHGPWWLVGFTLHWLLNAVILMARALVFDEAMVELEKSAA